MRWDLTPLPPIGAARPGDDATDREISQDDPAVIADDVLLDIIGLTFDALPVEPFSPRPDLIEAQHRLVDAHCRRARNRARRMSLLRIALPWRRAAA